MATINGTSGNDFDLFGSTRSDTINGLGGDDYLFGGGGTDVLNGGPGHDFLVGATGTVRFIGGTGNDCFDIGSNTRVVFVELSNQGFDVVNTLITFSLAAKADRANIEGAQLFGTANANLTGNKLSNNLLGNSGKNILSGGDGNDTLGLSPYGIPTGLGGNDTTIGGAGNDLHVFDGTKDVLKEASGGGTDTAGSASRGIILTSKQFLNIENATLFGNTDGLNLTGNTAKNKLTGNAGDNRINGGGGADSLFGMAGDDTLVYNNKAVKIDGGDGDDTLEVTGNLSLTGKGGSIILKTEGVHLVTNSTLTLAANDVRLMAPGENELTVTSNGGGILVSSSPWTFVQNATIDENTFRVYESGDVTINVESGINASGLATRNLSSLNGSNGIIFDGFAAGDGAGASVAVGDFNGDGAADVFVGSPFHEFGGDASGAAHVVLGGTREGLAAEHGNGLFEMTNTFGFGGAAGSDRAGVFVAAGDFNADGTSDLLVGAEGVGAASQGAAFVVPGTESPAGVGLGSLNGTNGFSFLGGPGTTDHTGRAVAVAGDLNGDGYDDFLVSAPTASPDSVSSAGSVYGVFGGGTLGSLHGASGFQLSTVDGTNGFKLNGTYPDANAGRSMAAGDFNDDGFGDIVLTHATLGVRSASLIFGGPGGHFDTLHGASGFDLNGVDGANGVLLIGGVSTSATAGGIFVASGDINGDGIADIVFTQSNSGGPGNGVGALFGGNSDWDALHGASGFNISALDGTNGFFAFDPSFSGGTSVAMGDVNGDGIADIVVGTPQANSGAGGFKTIFGGDNEHLSQLHGQSNLDPMLDGFFGFEVIGRAGDRAGWSVAVGDVDADGFADIIAGAPTDIVTASPTSTGPGSVSIFYGGNLNGAVEFVGTDASEDLGSADDNGQSFVGGTGNDSADGAAFDGLSFRMGAGDDVVIANALARVIDGGAGIDTWIPTSAVLDFTGMLGNRLVDFEIINLAETDATVTVNLNGWRGLASPTGAFKIDGDDGDTVVMPADRVLFSSDSTYDYFRLPGMPDSRTIGVHNAIIVSDLSE